MDALIERHRTEIERLCREFAVKRLGVFGSFAKEDPGNDSDVDFLVEMGPPDPDRASERYFGLIEGLKRLLGREVDLVCAEAIRNPVFRREVESTVVDLYAN